MEFTDTYYNSIDLTGCEFLKIQSDRDIAVIIQMAPTSTEARRLFLEQERAKVAEEHRQDALTDTFVLQEFKLTDGFFAEAERLYNIGAVNEDAIRVWHWAVAYKIGLINYELSLLQKDFVGIADALSKYCSGADDNALTSIILRHCVPDGKPKPTWKGKTQDAARFAKIIGMTASEFNTCFDGKKILHNSFKDGGYIDTYREHDLYKILDPLLNNQI